MTYEWRDKVVLITGAAAGIGALTVRKLVEIERVKHITILDVNEEGASIAQELNKKFGNDKVAFFKCDITKDDELDAAFKWIKDKFGYLDVLLNNAGIMNDSYQAYKKMVEVNVLDEYYSRTGVRMITICYGASGTSLLSKQKMGNFDESINNRMDDLISSLYLQKPENAANGLIDTYKYGENGSTWLSTHDKPVKDITKDVAKAYKILTDLTL